MEELFASEADQPKPRSRRRNIIWDAFVEIFEYEPLTVSEIKLWGKLTYSLRQAGATREILLTVVREYHKEFPGASLTPSALEKHYSRFAAKHKKTKPIVCSECGLGGGYHLAECSNKVEAQTVARASTPTENNSKPQKKGATATA